MKQKQAHQSVTILVLVLCSLALSLAVRLPAAALAQTTPPQHHIILYWGNPNVPFDPNNPFGLAPVLVFTDRGDVAAFALESYFKGPPPEALAAGFYADVDTGAISDGKVFTLSLESGAATVDIVQPISFFGDLSQGRLVTAITWMLTQFHTIDTVVVLSNGQPIGGLR